MLFLEAQFGADAVKPITVPRNSTSSSEPSATNGTHASADGAASTDTTADELSAEDKQEVKRLLHLGIPVPGIEIQVDKWVAKVWLEDLDVECANNPLRARIKAVVERAVETVSGLWS